MDAIYKLLQCNREAVISTYKKLRDIKGIDCIVRRPVTNGSIFGLEDLVSYDELVDCPDKLLIFGLMKEASVGMEGYDTFTDDCFVLTTYEEKLPLQTEIIVNFLGRESAYKVDDHRNLYPSICEQVLIKNILVPAT